MAVRSGKRVETHAKVGGKLTPQFCLQRPITGGVFYELVTTPGERIELLCDARVGVVRAVDVRSDVDMRVVRSVEVYADCLLRTMRRVDVPADMLSVITRMVSLDADVVLTIRRSAVIPASTPRPTEPTLEFLGKGLRFPFTFQRRSGGAQISTATSSDHAHIHESIRQILGTRKGERYMRPEFGTRLHELVFEPNDRLLYGLIRHEVIEALDEWEPRVVVTDVVVGPSDSDEHLVLVDIRYRLISAQVTGNLVYPFCRELE